MIVINRKIIDSLFILNNVGHHTDQENIGQLH